MGGAKMHTGVSGCGHFLVSSDEEGIDLARRYLSYFPGNADDEPPVAPPAEPAAELPAIPADENKPWNMHELIDALVDDGSFTEVHKRWAKEVIVGYARLDGHAVGIVANQPRHLAGTIDIAASEKAARFVRTCDAFNVPLLVFVDVPGFLPGIAQEHEGIIRRGSKLLYAFAEATVPRITVITRKAYGGAYVVMNSKHIGADFAIAWPTAEIAVMGPEAAVGLVFRRELAAADNPAARRAELVAEYEELFASPWQAAGRGYVDDVIVPSQTRPWLIRALTLARSKRVSTPPRKHGNIPL
jgi:acetyl-CoA carboxylase carboxyltransferase component